ncbi:MAG TPA: putative Ig domain-containing protein [Bryobacteraceae bacterium]|nr:putative Ig domain-containing protein [Bryobacteraceae bacterium]
MRSRISAPFLAACALAGAQGLPPTVTVTSGNSAVVQADQTVTTSGTITINAGTSVTFEAGNIITLQNGFHATAGSNFHAFIATPDFVINVTPTSGGTTLAGNSATYSVTVSSIFNFSGPVYFSPAGVTGLPQGATASFSASSITPPVNSTSSPITLTITTASGVTGNFAFAVVGASLGYPNHVGTSSLVVQDFTLTVSPSITYIPQSGAATFTVTVTGLNHFTGTVSFPLPITWLPSYPSADFTEYWMPTNSVTVPGSVTLTVVDRGNPVGLGWLGTLEGYANGVGHGATLWVGISPPASSALAVSCSATPNPAVTGQTVTFTANPSGGAPPYTYQWSGVSGSGQAASLTPATAGTYIGYVTLTDSQGRSASNSCTVSVQPGGSALTIISSSTLPYGSAGAAYSQTLQASGGTGSYTWSALSALPQGLTLSASGVLSGTPATAGSYTFYIKVADTGGHSVSSEFALTIASGGAQSSIQISLAYPQFSGGYPGGIHQFTFHFTDPLGPSDISGGQIAFSIDTTGPDLPVCQLDWNVNGQVDINGMAYGNFGGGQLSSTYCTVYAGESSLTQTAQGYDVSILVSFPQPLPNPLMPAWTRGITRSGAYGEFTPVGAHSLSPRVAIGQVPGDGYCGGTVFLDGHLNLYANGAIVGAVGASTTDIGYYAGWQNQVGYGQIYSISDVNNAIATNPNWSLVTIDSEESILPVPAGAPYPTAPGGVYYTQANYIFTNPNCTIVLEPGAPGISEGNTAIYPGFYIEFPLSGPSGDPTPHIDGISPSVINTGSNQVTITGGGFGTVQGSLAVCPSGANPCSGSNVAWSVAPGSWGPNSIVAMLNVPSTDNGNSYDIEVVSNGSLGTGFQSTGTTQATSNRVTVTVQASIVISGQVTMVGTNQPVSNVSIGLQDSNGVTYLPAHVTGSDGKYSWTVPVGGSYTVTPSLIGGNYWFDPQNATNISSTQTVNFTANPVTYVYLLHGIGQNASAMSALYQGLTAPGTGIDLRKYYVDPVGPNTGFTFACASSCGGECVTVNGTMINLGAQSLASYIYLQNPPGNIILVGYSMGGLIACDLIANNYIGVLTGHPVTAVITLGTPNLGYPYSSIDYSGTSACNQILDDMAGSWLLQTNGTTAELTSPYLSNLQQQWISASYPGYWMAAAGQQCSNQTRNLPPGSMVGCPSGNVTSDGVVCRDSALYGASTLGGYPGFNGGPGPSVPWTDSTNIYVHTTTWAGWGTAGVLCGNDPSIDIPLYAPASLPTGTLLPQIVAWINQYGGGAQ